MEKIKIEVGRRLYFLIMGCLVLTGVIGIVYAYGSGNPTIHGHDAGEISGLSVASNGSSLNVYDSGWFSVKTGEMITKQHFLGKTPLVVQLWFSDEPDGVGSSSRSANVVLAGTGTAYGAYTSQITKVDHQEIRIYTGKNYLVYFIDSDEVYTYPTKGYLKIVAVSN